MNPYSLQQEIRGSVRIIESLAPEGRRVTVLQWSGDTSPAAGQIAATTRAGLENINGGDSRFDERYAAIARGFYTARFLPLGDDHWRVINRGALNTIRFDDRTVDWTRSSGVIGQRYVQGSLYIALDESARQAEIALGPRTGLADARLHLEHARWRVSDVVHEQSHVRFRTLGFGDGRMVWIGERATRYRVRSFRNGELAISRSVVSDADGRPRCNLGASNFEPVDVTIEKRP